MEDKNKNKPGPKADHEDEYSLPSSPRGTGCFGSAWHWPRYTVLLNRLLAHRKVT